MTRWMPEAKRKSARTAVTFAEQSPEPPMEANCTIIRS